MPAHLRLLRPGYLRYADLPGFLGGALVACLPVLRRGLRPADPGGDGLRDAGAHHARGCRCPRWAATRSPTPREDPDRIATDLAALLHDEQRRITLAKAGFDRAKEFTWASSAEVHVADLEPGRGRERRAASRRSHYTPYAWMSDGSSGFGHDGGCCTP